MPPEGSAARAGAQAQDEPLSVVALTQAIQRNLAGFGRLRVEGELSGLKRAASGHVYFDLKDAKARISCVVWRSKVAEAAKHNPKEGDKVVAHGSLDVYAPRGGYSLIVERLEPLGEGALLAQFEALKRELNSRGWFERCRELPAFPACIGVVTSRDGAALRDFLRTRSMRWPGYPVMLRHAAVQGPGASQALAHALTSLVEAGCDLIVVTRGGGSLEDLWAFNEEPLAQAIHDCAVPVVSGVGHETDTTLADFCADARAHTPTDAAQLVFPDREELLERLTRAHVHLGTAIDGQLDERLQRVLRLARTSRLRDPNWILQERARQLSHLAARARTGGSMAVAAAERRLQALGERLRAASPAARVAAWGERLAGVQPRLVAAMRAREAESGRQLAVAAGRLEAYSPVAVLARGYAVAVTDPGGAAVRRAADLSPGDLLILRLHAGSARVRVESLEDEPEDGTGSGA